MLRQTQKTITNLVEFESIIDGDLVFIFFMAQLHQSFSDILKVLNDIQQKLPLGVEAYQIDVDENLEISKKYLIDSIPTAVLFKNSLPVESLEGIHLLPVYVEMLKRNM